MVEIKLKYFGNNINKNYLEILTYLDNEKNGFELINKDIYSQYKYNPKLKTKENEHNSNLEILIADTQNPITIKTSDNKPIYFAIPVYAKCISNNYKIQWNL